MKKYILLTIWVAGVLFTEYKKWQIVKEQEYTINILNSQNNYRRDKINTLKQEIQENKNKKFIKIEDLIQENIKLREKLNLTWQNGLKNNLK